jgi:hypothetical protein
MPGPLTYAAIMLMARDRLRHIRDALRAKRDSGRQVRDIERRVLHLAEQAYEMMSVEGASVPAPLHLYGPPFGDQVSRFALVGSIGPELPGYAALFAPGQRWLRDTLHKGTPDEHREQVLVHSCNLPLKIWEHAHALITREITDNDQRDAALKAMRGYVLGHFCHVAADVVSAPYLQDITAHLGEAGRAQLSQTAAIGAIETRVSTELFRRGTDTRGRDWNNWWPSGGDLPGVFFRAWKLALEELYGNGAVRPGLAAYEAQRQSDEPPALSEDLLKDGYATFRNVVQTGAAWDLLDWMGVLAPMFVPAILAMPIAAALPQGKNRFLEPKPAGYDEDIATYEMTVFPFALTSVVPLIGTLCVTLSHVGVSDAVIFGWVNAAVQIIAAVAFFASLGGAGAERWIPIFVVPTVLELVHIVFTLVKGRGAETRHWQLALSSMLHLVLSGLFVLLFAGFLHEGVEVLNGHGDAGTFVWQLLVWVFVILGGLWMGLSLLFYFVIGGRLPGGVASDFVTSTRHHIRLFDDTTLYTTRQGTSPTLADLHYPSGRRPLLKMWWTGAGTPTVRSTRDTLIFDFGGGTTRTVHAPLAPTTLPDYAELLQRTVKDGGNNASLHVELVHTDDLDYSLPAGLVFSDHGDVATTESDYNTKRNQPHGLTEADPYILHHALKAQHSVRFNRKGPATDGEDRTGATNGSGNVDSAVNSLVVTARPGATPFSRLFRAGDLLEAPQGSGVRRVIVSVDSDTSLTVSTPFPAARVNATFQRAAQDRRVDTPLSGAGWLVQSHAFQPNDVVGAGGDFGTMFKPGDRIRIMSPANGQPHQEFVVLRVISGTQLHLSRRPAANIAGPGVQFLRLGEPDLDLHTYVATGDDTLDSSAAVMDEAADLAALLCLGGASHLAADQSRVNRVYQVFRNWNLDRRRVNEWKMLVLGGARSEKRGDAAATDPAMAPPDGEWRLRVPNGEDTANSLGWVRLLRAWLDMARRPEQDATADVAFRPGEPTNRALSRGLAYLLDMPEP